MENIRAQLFEPANHAGAEPGKPFVALSEIRLSPNHCNLSTGFDVVSIETRTTKGGNSFCKQSREEIEDARGILDGKASLTLKGPDVPGVGQQVVNVPDGDF